MIGNGYHWNRTTGRYLAGYHQWDTYIRYLAGYRPIIRGTPGASNFRLISLANTETLLSQSFMLVKHCSIWKLHLFTIRQSIIQSLHLSIKTLPSLSSMLLQIWLKSLFCDSIWETTFLEENNGSVNCATDLLCFFMVLWPEGWEEGYGRWDLRWCYPPLMQQNTKLVLRQCVAIVAKQMLNLGNQGGDRTPTNAELAFSTGEKANWVKFNKNQNRSDEAGYGRWRWFVVMQHNTELVLPSKNLNSQFLLSWQEVLVGLHRYLN